MEWKIKNRRSEHLDELIEKSLDDQKDVREVTSDKISKRERVSKSLLFSDDKECHSISQRIKDCKKFQTKQRQKTKPFVGVTLDDGRKLDPFRDVKGYVGKYVNNKEVCQSLWCPHCRKFLSKMYENRLRERLTQRLLPNEYTNEDFHHLSGVLGVCEVDENEVLKLIKNDTNRWRRIRYRVNTLIQPKDCPFIETVYEFELVNWRFLKNSKQSDFKKKQIQQIIEHQRFKGSVFLFVHFHSITNLSKQQIDEVFRNEYFIGRKPLIKTNQQNGLYVQNFNSKQTLEENIQKLCSYPFKDPHRFKHSFRGSDYLNGEYFEYEELSKLIKVYQKVQKRSWRGLFRSVEHQRSVEFCLYKRIFPSTHPIWNSWSSIRHFSGRTKTQNKKQRMKRDQNDLTKVWMIDPKGNVYTDGWDPNLFFPNGLEYDTIQRNKKKVGRKYFIHPQYYWLEIYKNIYEWEEDTIVTKSVRLENFYYPKGHKFLGRDQYIEKNKWGHYQKHTQWMNKKDIDRMFKRMRIKDVDKIPKNLEFDISDPNFVKRMENLQRLEGVDKEIYFRTKVLNDLKRLGRRRTN